MIIAFDLDGTLCNIEHRLHFIKQPKKDWLGFFNACEKDEPVWPIIHACQTFATAGHAVQIWSGRSDVVRPQTEYWLFRHEISYSKLLMRQDGDFRSDDIVKGEWLDALPEILRPSLVFDDRKRVVDMWRSRGIKCCQVEPGDF